PAHRDSGAGVRGALRVHALVERVHLRPHVHVVVRPDPGERRGDPGADPGRYLLLGRAHGRRHGRLDPDRGPLCLLPRLLRLRAHGRRDQIGRRGRLESGMTGPARGSLFLPLLPGIALSCGAVGPASAAGYHWVDRDGVAYYTTGPNRIPEAYRDQVRV